MHTTHACFKHRDLKSRFLLTFSARLEDVFSVETGQLGREMESKWKSEVTNQNSVASAALDSA